MKYFYLCISSTVYCSSSWDSHNRRDECCDFSTRCLIRAGMFQV